MRRNNWKKGIIIIMAGLLVLGHITNQSIINATTYNNSDSQEVTIESQETTTENQETATENQELTTENQEVTTEKAIDGVDSPDEQLSKTESDDLLEETLIQHMDGESSGTQADIPDTYEELDISKTYLISSNQGWLNLQNICKEGKSLEGFKFMYTSNISSDSDGYNFSEIDGFTGIGTSACPFAGQLNRLYETSIPLSTNKPIFAYLSSKAVIDKMDITVNGASAGLANTLVMESAVENSTLNLTNISIKGTVDSEGTSGGLFAEVTNNTDYMLTIAGNSVNLNNTVVHGKVVGGLIGSISGNVTLQLDGGITWAPVTEMKNGITETASIGGLIGKIRNDEDKTNSDGSKRNICITGNSIVYNGPNELETVVTGNRGGIIGSIENAEVTFDVPVTYNGKAQDTNANGKDSYVNKKGPESLFDLRGEIIGTLAGTVENSTITLNNTFLANNVWMEYKNNTTAGVTIGVGGLVGVMENSSFEARDTITINGMRVQQNSGSNDYVGFIGGVIGSTYNSGFVVSENKTCTVNSFETYETNGTIGGAIGSYEVTDSNVRTIANVTAKSLRLITNDENAKEDCIGGLIGDMKLGGTNVTISNCYVNNVSLRCYNAASLGVGRVTASTGGKLIMDNVVCISTNNMLYNGQYKILKCYGGAIGIADSDFEIKGSELNEGGYSSGYAGNTKEVYNNSTNRVINYAGGLIGKVENTQENQIRRGTVRNVIVGGYIYGQNNLTYEAFGGLFGATEDGVSICLNGTIEQNGGSVTSIDGNPTTLEAQKTSLKQKNIGSVVGIINNSLIYLEKDATLHPSTTYTCNEIGNYGGVIRNDTWGEQNQLIQDHKVTGKLEASENGKYTIDTTADLVRLAIALNTEGKFLPSGNFDDSGNPDVSFDDLNKATYNITVESIDLTNTGVMCLNRNDETGSPFQGSLIGKEGNTTIKNTVNSYSQSWIGLFSQIKGNSSVFKNLSLEYSVLYGDLKSSGVNRSDMQYFAQGAGGLAAVAEGGITVENVSYSGSMLDTNNEKKYYVDSPPVGDRYFNGTDYFGGIFGEYKLLVDEKLIMDGVSVNMTEFTYDWAVHVFGGMIAYVNLDAMPKKMTTTSTDIIFKNISLSGKMSLKCGINTPLGNFDDSTKIMRSGSFIALIGNASTGENYEKKCDISIQNLNINNLNQSYQYQTTSTKEMGGFWGYKWTDAWITISSTEGNKNVVENSTLQNCSLFGGLVNTVYGKMSLEDFSFGQNVSINTLDASQLLTNTTKSPDEVNCGLLVRDGRYLYLTVKDYTGANNVTLQNYGGTYFDELVGFNRGGNDDKHGGIVSIEQSGGNGTNILFLGRNNNSYTSYSDGMNTLSNPNTRYYYDLSSLTYPTSPSTGESGKENPYSTLDSPDDIMAWHLMHYANSQIRTCLDPNFEALPSDYKISGNIDMQGYSIYPTHSFGESYTCTGASITFHAAEIIAGEKAKKENTEVNVAVKYPENAKLQHYQMQSGLFDTVAGITVDGLTLKGTYSQVQHSVDNSVDYAGALICGTIYGIELEEKDSQGKTQYDENVQNTIRNIVMDNLWCVSSFESGYKNYEKPLGLMIADISSGAKVTFDKISMSNYDTGSLGYPGYPGYTVSEDDKAASSLIGNVGGKDARCITLKFTNLDLADVATGKSSDYTKSTGADEALAKSSVMYSYEYAEKCNAIYTFNYEDYTCGTELATPSDSTDKYVTLGIELGIVDTKGSAEVEYYDCELKVGQIKEGENFNGINYTSDHFIPYVYTYNTNLKNLTVNPKVGHLTNGCGTYEDPYVISSTKQLLTLYRYLYKESDYEDILKENEWKVNEVGYDDTFCNRDSPNHTEYTYGKTDDTGVVVFPSEDSAKRLSQAYYLISADIDLSKEVEFAGFGSAEQPFIGVFVGRKSDNSQPVIKMSQQTAPQPAYGFIQYAKGCVIKDLSFQYDSTVPIAAEGGIGGGVIASVLGGDNILDNVTVKGNTIDPNNNGVTEIIPCFEPKDTDSIIGGYVGVVELGGVIIRNMEESSLINFTVSFENNAAGDALSTENCLLINGIIGKVEDGYVLDENSKLDNENNHNTSLAVNAEQYPSNAKLPASRSYDIVNKLYLDKMILGDPGDSANSQAGKIVWQNKQYDIRGAAQLQVMSMALNAGMLNYISGRVDFGYSANSRTRYGAYSGVGTVENATNTDYIDVTKYDNWNKIKPDDLSSSKTGFFRSYLMRYFDFEDSILNDPKATYNVDAHILLNLWGLGENLTNAQTYCLSTIGTYDMSVYGTAFRGFGARYNKTYNVFHSHMKGNENGNTVVNVDMLVDGIQDAEDVAFLNTVSEQYSTKADCPLKISDITLTGRVINAEDIITTDETGVRTINVTRKEQESTHNAAGWISKATGFIEFSNVYLKNIDIQSQSFAGGYIAKYESSGLPTFVNCGIQSDDTTLPASFENINYSNKIEGVLETGGFIGWMSSNTSSEKLSFIIDKKSSTNTNILESVKVRSYGKWWVSDSDYTITSGSKLNIYITKDIYQPATGGLIGRVNVNKQFSIEIDGADLEEVFVRGEGGSAGGFIGICDTNVNINASAQESSDYQTRCQWLSVESGGKYVQTGGLIGAMKYSSAGESKICSVFMNNLSVRNTYEKAKLDVSTYSEYLDTVVATAGIVGATNFTTTFSHVDIGSSNDGSIRIENVNRVGGVPPKHTTYGVGGFLGRSISEHKMYMHNCGIYGRRENDDYTTVISAFGNSGAIASNIRTATCENVKVESVKVESARFIGGLCGYAESGNTAKLTDFTLKDSYLLFIGNAEDENHDGDIGGIVGRGTGKLNVNGVNIDGNRIDSDYCEYAGGLVGRMVNELTIGASSNNNLVQNNMICGRTVGGVTGYIANPMNIEGITIQKNKLISSLEKKEVDANSPQDKAVYDKTYSCAGGVAGILGDLATTYAEDVIIKENLISGYYDEVKDVATLGGVMGLQKGESYFYHTDLQDNYIGQIHKEDLTGVLNAESKTEDEQIALRKEWLWDTPIVATTGDTSSVVLRDMLYYVHNNNNNDDYTKKIAAATILEDEYYLYCYCQGAVVGYNSTASASYIRTNIDYTEDKYRPVSDVGYATGDKWSKVGNNKSMYSNYREKIVIVYDGYDTKKEENNIFETYFGTPSYPFGNIEEIWGDYQGSSDTESRNAFLLSENYQNRTMQDTTSDDSVYRIDNVYKNTYKNDTGRYLSDFKIVLSDIQQETSLPMVVYRSSACGSIDNVLQTYINMITNNSGALNSSVGVQTTSGNYLINATTKKYELTDGVIVEVKDKNDTSCITVTPSMTNGYKTFTFGLDGYDEFTDSKNGTFSVVTVQYLYGTDVKWEFDIPVYVEPMLQIDSHMSMLEGIQYDIDAIKEKGTQSDETSYNEKILSSGNSYSLYLEYIYGETRKHYPDAVIPKQFYMEDYQLDDDSKKKLKFMPGTRLTLIAIDEGSRPYYYTVKEGESIDNVLFTKFKDSNENCYELKNINTGCTTYTDETPYTNLHDKTLSNVAVEQYLIIVDLSEASVRDGNNKYRLRVTPESLSSSNNEAEKVLSNRLDYNEHCKVYFNEIPGISYKIDETNTEIIDGSKISNSGEITLNMQYSMEADLNFWKNNANNPFIDYLDVAIYLKKGEDKIALPIGTQVQFNNQVLPVTDSNTSTIYYYKQILDESFKLTGAGNSIGARGDDSPIINSLNNIVFDFRNADLSGLENGSDYKICVDLIVTSDPDRPADGDVKASWSANVAMEGKTDIGFALQVKDQRTLGMNGYQPESTDSGVVPYTASIAFPAACRESNSESAQAANKYYTIVYQIYEKTKSDEGTKYVPYTGTDVSIYLGDITDGDSTTGDDTENQKYNSGAGITAVTYKFTQDNIIQGAILSDGLNADVSATSTPAMIQTNCTLVANRDKLKMTNYKVEAYLLITDEQSYPNSFTTTLLLDNVGCVYGYKCRSTDEGVSSWKEFSAEQKKLLEDAKNDFFIFTVARIKTSMQ